MHHALSAITCHRFPICQPYPPLKHIKLAVSNFLRRSCRRCWEWGETRAKAPGGHPEQPVRWHHLWNSFFQVFFGLYDTTSKGELWDFPLSDKKAAKKQQVDALGACTPPAPFLQAPDVCSLCCTISGRSSPKKTFGGVWPLCLYPQAGFQWCPLPFGPTSPTQPALCSSI